jgi:hypothetical protein
MKKLAAMKKLLKQTDLKGVADPSKFKKVWDDFNEHMITYFVGDFVHDFEVVTDTGKLAALAVMNDFVAVFDDALKTMSRSKAYQIVVTPSVGDVADRIKIDKDKGFTFKLMLRRYLEVLKVWWELLGKLDETVHEKMRYMGMSVKEALTFVEGQLGVNESIGIKGKQEADFRSSTGYNVAEGVIGSGALWDRCQPKTLEDVFTFIHQSLLTIIGTLNRTRGLPLNTATTDQVVPNELQVMHKMIISLPTINVSNGGTLLISSLRDGIVRLLYNWPQRNHSASIEVVYFHKKKEMELSLRFFGHNGHARWNFIADSLKVKRCANAWF